MSWIKYHQAELKNKGSFPLFKSEKYQSNVYIHGFGDRGKAFIARSPKSESIFWLLQGKATLKINGNLQDLSFDDIFLAPKSSWVEFESMSEDCAILPTTMDPSNKSRIVL
jgi:mannose-6-phosphate isomerase-like protein (cupin superfamily)